MITKEQAKRLKPNDIIYAFDPWDRSTFGFKASDVSYYLRLDHNLYFMTQEEAIAYGVKLKLQGKL